MADPIPILPLFDPGAAATRTRLVVCAGATRTAWQVDQATSALLDIDHESDARCLMLRLTGSSRAVTLALDDCASIEAAGAGGWLLPRQAGSSRCFWLPRAPVLRRLDDHARIRSDETAAILALNLDGQCASTSLAVPDGAVLDCVIWDLPAALANELRRLEPPEGQGLFLWGSHTVFHRPADLYRHLVHGHVYEDRYEWPLRRKTPSENDAHALSTCISGLAGATGKRVYRILERQLLLAVLDRQDEDGGFRHGEWTEARESHFRLHASAMHLMMDALAAGPDGAVQAALARAMAYATRQRDDTSLGAWFLHDELELSSAGMDAGPFKWIPSTVCGKSPTNMLVLNTHLDTLVALLRYRELTGDRSYDALIDSARAAALGVLALRPMEWLYAAMFRLFGLTFLPTHRASTLPVPQRALKRIAWRWLLPWLPRMKARWPRLVMPGGYVDRDLSLQTWSHRYLTVNAMDLARIARRLPGDPQFLDVLTAALRFTEHSGIAEKWREKEADQYSIGFLVEALYQICTLSPAWEWRALLAKQSMAALDLGLGLSPSILGCNREIDLVPARCPCVGDERLRVIAIRQAAGDEVMLVNPSTVSVAQNLAYPPAGVRWRDADGNDVDADSPLPPRSWRLGTPR